MLVEAAFFRVVEVKGVQEGSQDGDVCWVGSSGGVILVPEALEERSKYWIICMRVRVNYFPYTGTFIPFTDLTTVQHLKK